MLTQNKAFALPGVLKSGTLVSSDETDGAFALCYSDQDNALNLAYWDTQDSSNLIIAKLADARS